MKVKDIMTPRPLTVRSDLPLRAAARLLADHQVTALPVVDEHHRIVGVISEADVVARDRLTDPVANAMTTKIALVHPETDLDDLRRVMTGTPAKSLPVVDAADQVVGMVSRSDVVRAFAPDDEMIEQSVTDLLAAARVTGCHVQVRNGIVDLTGIAPTDQALDEVMAAVAAVPGVVAAHTW